MEQESQSSTPKPETTQSNNNQTTVNSTETLNNNITNQTTPQMKLVREEIKFEQVYVDFIDLTENRLNEFRTKLNTLKEKEREIRKRAAALNSLETFIFDFKDKITQDEFIKCSTESERETLSKKLDEADAWMSDSDDSVETKAFTEKLNDLKSTAKSILFRIKEKKLRPKRLEELKDVLNRSVEFLNNSKNLTGTDLPLTETEWNTLDKLINSTKDWRVKMLNEQAKVAENEDPKLLSSDIQEKIDALKREVNYLVSKIKYFRPKTKKPPTAEKQQNKTANATNTDESNGTSNEEDESTKNQQEESNKNEDNYFNEEDGDQQDEQNEKTSTTTETSSTNNPEL
jgi:hypoxia up-regulated 1